MSQDRSSSRLRLVVPGVVAMLLIALVVVIPLYSSRGHGTSAGTDSRSPHATARITPTGRAVTTLDRKYTNALLEKWIEENRIPEAPAHRDAFLTMANTFWHRGAPDIAIFGDSMAQQGFDPAVISRLVSARTGSPARTFNAASSRARWGVNRMLVRYAAKHHVLPKVAILTISTRAAESDAFYRNDVSTQPFSSVAEGCQDRTPARTRTCEREVTDLRFRFRNREDILDRAAKLHRWPTAMLTRDGWGLRSDGMVLHPTMTVAQVEADSERRLQHNPGLPHLDQEARQMFGETVGLLRSRGVTVIAVSFPYSPIHQQNLDAKYRGYDERRRRAATELAASAHVPLFVVTSFGSWWGDGDSRDAIHLSKQGAGQFMHQLWTMPGFADAVVNGLG